MSKSRQRKGRGDSSPWARQSARDFEMTGRASRATNAPGVTGMGSILAGETTPAAAAKRIPGMGRKAAYGLGATAVLGAGAYGVRRYHHRDVSKVVKSTSAPLRLLPIKGAPVARRSAANRPLRELIAEREGKPMGSFRKSDSLLRGMDIAKAQRLAAVQRQVPKIPSSVRLVSAR